jgi:aspartate/methionine/tyrosine aminotransferase
VTRPLLNRRYAGFGNTIFGVMSARALATGSVNLGQGFPDVDGPSVIAQTAAEAVLTGKGNQYPPATGIPEIGWVTAAPDLVNAVRTTKQFLTYVNGGPFQYAVARALDLPGSYFSGMAADLKAKRDLVASGLADIGFEVYQPDGTYFITTDIAPLGERDGMEFCLALPDRAGVVAIPSAVFYDDHPEAGRTQVRFAFCKRHEVLKEALSRLSVLAR